MLILAMPKDRLLMFHWSSPAPLPTTIVQLLCRRQQKLEELQVHFGIMTKTNPTVDLVDLRHPPSITSLSIATDRFKFKDVTRLIRRYRISTLTVNELHSVGLYNIPTLANTLFSGQTQAASMFANITKLRLIEMNLPTSTNFPLNQLRELELEHCKNVSPILHALTSVQPPSLQVFQIKHREEVTNPVSGALLALLALSDGLRSFNLCLRYADKGTSTFRLNRLNLS